MKKKEKQHIALYITLTPPYLHDDQRGGRIGDGKTLSASLQAPAIVVSLFNTSESADYTHHLASEFIRTRVVSCKLDCSGVTPGQ